MTDTGTARGTSRRGLQARGALALAGLLALGALAHASYTRAFSDEVTVTLLAERSGLLLEPGADVALRNVSVGRVVSVQDDEEGASIELAIERDTARMVDPAAGARIVSPTLLGPKYVELGLAEGTPTGAQDGDVVTADSVQVEANAAFEHLVSVLDGVQPAQLTTALGAFSTTLEGRGRQLGDYLDQANAYFARFNASLPAMERDLDGAAEVTRIYADIAPDLLAILDATTATGQTVVSRSQALDGLLQALEQTSDVTRSFLANNRLPLDRAMALLRPTTTTMARYAPIFPCLFASLNDYRRDVEPASGGRYPGLWVHLSVLPGSDGYDPQADLPVVRADNPSCLGGPIGPDGHYRPPGFDDGSPSLDNTNSPITPQETPLSVQLFGRDIDIPPATTRGRQ